MDEIYLTFLTEHSGKNSTRKRETSWEFLPRPNDQQKTYSLHRSLENRSPCSTLVQRLIGLRKRTRRLELVREGKSYGNLDSNSQRKDMVRFHCTLNLFSFKQTN